jgi:hypothetical protein
MKELLSREQLERIKHLSEKAYSNCLNMKKKEIKEIKAAPGGEDLLSAIQVLKNVEALLIMSLMEIADKEKK